MSATGPDQPPARTRANGRASRSAILEAALEVFAERGYAGTTIGEISKRVGMSQAGLLHHFPTKDALLLEVIAQRAAAQRDSFDGVFAAGGDILGRLLGTMAEENLATRVHQQLFTTLSAEAIRPDHPAHDVFVQRYRQLSRLLGRQFARLDIPAEEAALLAREVLATVDGLHQQWLLDPDSVDLKEALASYGRHLRLVLSAARGQARLAGELRESKV